MYVNVYLCIYIYTNFNHLFYTINILYLSNYITIYIYIYIVEVIALGAGSVEEEATPPVAFEWDPNAE